MKPICIFLLVFLLLSGCEDIFEQDIEDASIEVIAPKNNTRTEAMIIFAHMVHIY